MTRQCGRGMDLLDGTFTTQCRMTDMNMACLRQSSAAYCRTEEAIGTAPKIPSKYLTKYGVFLLQAL